MRNITKRKLLFLTVSALLICMWLFLLYVFDETESPPKTKPKAPKQASYDNSSRSSLDVAVPSNLKSGVSKVDNTSKQKSSGQREATAEEEAKSDISTVVSISDDELPISGTSTTKKAVALTFDHSWGNTFTPKILDILKRNGLRVTFFLMGPWAEQYPDVARRMVAEGHEIGSHGYRHENYGEKSSEWILDDFKISSTQIKKVTGIQPRLFRPPNGHYSEQSLKITAQQGYKTIMWNVDSLDWMNPGQDEIVSRVMRRVKPGAIILMHASDTPVQTADTLPILLKELSDKGYKIVTVSELLDRYSEGGIIRR